MARAAAVIAAVAVMSAAARAGAGPCLACSGAGGPFRLGWWNERPLSPAGRQPGPPRIDAGEGPGGVHIGVVWSEAGSGNGDLQLARSSDGGCSWDITALTADPADDRSPDLSLVPGLGFVAISFVRDRAPWVMVSQNGGVSFAAPQRIHPSATVEDSGPPRVVALAIDAAIHLQVVWSEAGALRHARSLVGGQAGTWESATVPLSARFGGFSALAAPDLAVDTRSADPARHSAVNIAFTALGPGSAAPEVFVVRSNDSGASFQGDPAVPASLDVPRRVSDAATPGPGAAAPRLALDGSDDGSGVFSAWNALAWGDPTLAPGGCWLDARAEEGTGPTVLSEWNDPPVAGDVEALPAAGAVAALAVIPNPLDRPVAPELHVFREETVDGGGLELGALHGTLEARVRPTVALDCGPYPLSGVAPARSSGAVVAGSGAADEDLSHAHVVWLDDRDGAPRVWFKRSDSVTDPPERLEVLPAACAEGGGLVVSWTPPRSPPNCDLARFRVEWGAQPGSFSASLDIAASPARLAGLPAGSQWQVRVVTVDEACNEAASGEVAAVVPDCGSPRCPNGIGSSLRAVKNASLDVVLGWQPPAADPGHDLATGYDVWRADVRARDGYARRASPVSASWVDPGAAGAVSPAPHLYYQVVARNGCGTSGDEPPR